MLVLPFALARITAKNCVQFLLNALQGRGYVCIVPTAVGFLFHRYARYRQWMTHKLATWIDQFETSGCFKYSYAFVILPGGFGTMDECFEALTLIQSGKIHDFPLVVMDNTYWRNLQELLDDMLKAGTVNAKDLRLLYYADSVDEAIVRITTAVEKFGVFHRPVPSKILRETG
jgi:hypothetical protein